MTDSGVSRRITNMLLEWLGSRNRKSFLIGCTNFLENMDLAFIRSGRVDEVCLVLPPDRVARREILRLHCNVIRQIPITSGEQAKIFDQIATETFLWTGAELEKLCLDSARLAMEEKSKKVKLTHFVKSMNSFEVNLKERKETINQMVRTLKKMENVSKAFLEDALKEFEEGEGDKARVKSFIAGI